MKFYKVVFIKKIISLLITFIFLIFAILNINDPDGLIWILTYISIACLPWIKKANQKLLNLLAVLISIFGLFIIFGLLNSIMPQQFDDQMVNLWEYQREGIGLMLGAVWLALGKKLVS
mgnify:FL=1|jgi:hypothetical protein|tara:strand:- start:69 stop:422 length:354 start_codon:yes stop_codon:yes gene_type:complete